ncbi:VanZ family protein [Salinisphaera sp. SPP-AMP-43]|uniref:VanZ family protein n=1 Tax=Salinisphaera sp. SPP-AMP-43 TaxID=3121288 RepID=UPI003C6DEB64
MPNAHPYRRFIGAAVLALAFIVYGSLYPFHFQAGSLGEAIRTLFLSHDMDQQPPSGLVANIALYIPLGLFGVAAQSAHRARWLRIVVITLIGTLLCLSIEIIQFFDAGRMTTLTDVYPNVGGTLVGGLLAAPLTRYLTGPIHLHAPARQVAALIILLFLGYRLFPYVPTIDLHAYWQALKPVVYAPHPAAFDIARYLVIWLVVALMLADLAGPRRSRWLIGAAVLVVAAAKVGITHNHLSAAELIALPCVVIVWQLLASASRRRVCGFLAVLLALIVLGERLLPFEWGSYGHSFGWIPFYSILHGSMAANTQALAEKLFLYTSLLWLLRGVGLRYTIAGTLVAAGLFLASLLETHLPGRSAEITDAVIAVLATWVLASLAPEPIAGTNADAPSARRGPSPGPAADLASAQERVEHTGGHQ